MQFVRQGKYHWTSSERYSISVTYHKNDLAKFTVWDNKKNRIGTKDRFNDAVSLANIHHMMNS